MRKTLSLILIAVLMILIVVFTLQNSDQVLVKFFSYEFSSSLSLILFLTFALGFIIAVLVMSPGKINDNKTIKRLNKNIKGLEKEIEKHKEIKRNMEKENKETQGKPFGFEDNLLANK